MKRILDCDAADFRMIESGELLEAIQLSEGRTLLCEVLWPATPLADSVSNAQLAVAFGADLVLLNMFSGDGLAGLKSRLGSPVGVNVEPSENVPGHRRASRGNLKRLEDADFIVITANPDAKVDMEEVVSAVELARETIPGALVFAGRMHGSGGRGLMEPGEMARLASVVNAVLIPGCRVRSPAAGNQSWPNLWTPCILKALSRLRQ